VRATPFARSFARSLTLRRTDQDDTLDSLSTAIARQHSLSLNIASELEMQSSLLDDTDSALDRTETSLRRAGGRLNQYSRKAKETGSTGLIVLLVIVLIILIVLFK
jgi:syntaxin 8